MVWRAGAALDAIPAPLAVLPLATAMLLNRRFYFFLASRRGWIFAAGAVLLHLAYYFYRTLAFGAATAAHALDHRRPNKPA